MTSIVRTAHAETRAQRTEATQTRWLCTPATSRARYLYDVFFYRALPYDPVRPWKGTDGQWYSTIAVDACNTTKHHGCAAGSRNELWRSPASRRSADGRSETQLLKVFPTTVVYSGKISLGRDMYM